MAGLSTFDPAPIQSHKILQPNAAILSICWEMYSDETSHEAYLQTFIRFIYEKSLHTIHPLKIV